MQRNIQWKGNTARLSNGWPLSTPGGPRNPDGPAPSSNDDEVRAYLLGAVFGALCHQRGITPLHASAIDVADGCVAFVGASGAGKSTLVAALAQRGHEIIGDDECFLQLGTNGEVQAWPGISGIRLCEDARAALGFDGAGVERAMHGYNKYFVPVRPPRNPIQSRRLREVYQLHRVPNGVTEVTRLRGADAVEVLMQNVYPPGLADRLGYQAHVFMFVQRWLAMSRCSGSADLGTSLLWIKASSCCKIICGIYAIDTQSSYSACFAASAESSGSQRPAPARNVRHITAGAALPWRIGRQLYRD